MSNLAFKSVSVTAQEPEALFHFYFVKLWPSRKMFQTHSAQLNELRVSYNNNNNNNNNNNDDDNNNNNNNNNNNDDDDNNDDL
jgi:hypothetical protein